jgi:SdrD B-like protein
MSQEVRHAALKERTKTLLEGPLKHIRGAALAAALLPLASIAAAPASAQDACPPTSGGVCVSGFVWNDTNKDGIRDSGETGIEGAKVTLFEGTTEVATIDTGPGGFFFFAGVLDGPHTIAVSITNVLAGMEPSPTDQGGNDTVDSDGMIDSVTHLASVVTFTVAGVEYPHTDFGFFAPAVQPPGTGTPGYWKNHPNAWPGPGITVGGIYYEKSEAIAWLGKVGKDKTTTMFSSLVSAMLNLWVGNPGACLIQGQTDVIASANAWMAAHPVGSGVAASSPAWAAGEPLHKWLDAYNNGLLCDPHRN